MDHDRLFKELLGTFFVDFLALFFPGVVATLDQESIEFLDKEVFTDVTAGQRHEADLVARAQFRGKQSCFLIHVEHQAQPQAEFAARMFSYFARLHEKHHLPVYPIAVFSYDRPTRRAAENYQVEACDLDVLLFRFRVVQLNTLDWRDFTERTDPLVAALMSRMRIEPVDRPRVKAACLRMLARLQLNPARETLISGFVDSYLRLTMEENEVLESEVSKAPPREQERVMKIVTSWMEQGIEQGLELGRAEGRHAEALALVTRQLTAKGMTPLTPEVESRLGTLSLDKLEALAEALLGFSIVADLDRWLEGNQP